MPAPRFFDWMIFMKRVGAAGGNRSEFRTEAPESRIQVQSEAFDDMFIKISVGCNTLFKLRVNFN